MRGNRSLQAAAECGLHKEATGLLEIIITVTKKSRAEGNCPFVRVLLDHLRACNAEHCTIFPKKAVKWFYLSWNIKRSDV